MTTKTTGIVFLLVVAVMGFIHDSVAAVSLEQKKVIGSGIPYFNVENTQYACGATDTALTGSENGEKIYNFFITKGLTPVQAAGFMGNLEAESPGFNPGTQEIKPLAGRGGYGIAQWTASRRVALEKAAAEKNIPVNDLAFQLDFLWAELEGSYYKPRVLDPLKKTSDLLEATKIVLFEFESPANEQSKVTERYKLSLTMLTKYGSMTPGSATAGGVVTSTCGSVMGNGLVTSGYSLPVDEKYYRSNPEWFTKPHHVLANGGLFPASDIPVSTGTTVYSMTDGKITKAPNGTVKEGYGLGVTVDAGNGVEFVYGHGLDGGTLAGAIVGDVVKAGQPIMRSGNTGTSTGPHVHVEVRVGGRPVCPQSLFVGIIEKKVPDVKSLPATGCSKGSIYSNEN